jgi:RNA polymerase primary sigma factor
MSLNGEMSREAFKERLLHLLQLAEKQKFVLSVSEIQQEIKELHLNEEQLELVYDFLRSKKVQISGLSLQTPVHRDRSDLQLTHQEEVYLDRYEEELQEIQEPGEITGLIEQAAAGDAEAVQTLTEILLPDVLQMALDLHIPEVSLPDLIQEGNLQLVLAISETDWKNPEIRAHFREKMLERVSAGMRTLLEEQKEMHTRDRKMVNKVEDFSDGVKILKEELGRKVYLDEVADFMSITEEEVEDIMRLAGQEVAEGDAEESGSDENSGPEMYIK